MTILKRFPYALAVALFALTAGARAQSTSIEVAADEARVEFSSRGPLAEMRITDRARSARPSPSLLWESARRTWQTARSTRRS